MGIPLIAFSCGAPTSSTWKIGLHAGYKLQLQPVVSVVTSAISRKKNATDAFSQSENATDVAFMPSVVTSAISRKKNATEPVYQSENTTTADTVQNENMHIEMEEEIAEELPALPIESNGTHKLCEYKYLDRNSNVIPSVTSMLKTVAYRKKPPSLWWQRAFFSVSSWIEQIGEAVGVITKASFEKVIFQPNVKTKRRVCVIKKD